MLSPGSKGWISKYFDLVEKGELWVSIRNYHGLSDIKHLHLTFSRSGIIFGLPTRAIFGHRIDTSNWTNTERLKVLLFESLLFVHLKHGGKLDKDDFVESLIGFYGNHNSRSIMNVFTFFLKESNEEKLEKIFTKRLDIKLKLLENSWWVNSLNNAFVYLDVILFNDYCTNEEHLCPVKYSEFATNALTAITMTTYADGVVDKREKDLFNVFLASANLSEEDRNTAVNQFNSGAGIEDFDDFVKEHELFKRFLLDVALLTVFSDSKADDSELIFMDEFRLFLGIHEDELEETYMFVEDFIIENRHQSEFLNDAPSYEKVYSRFSGRWGKILSRNKDKLSTELAESKELVALIRKSVNDELTAEEKEKVKEQSKDLLKTLPAIAVFMIPGGTILLPMMLKLLPEMLPSAFRNNEIDK